LPIFIDAQTILDHHQALRDFGHAVNRIRLRRNASASHLVAYLRAREAGQLAPHEESIARQVEIIARACARVDIIALIDEATGFEAFKKKRDLQPKLRAFMAEDLQEWARMFPQDFWLGLARLGGIHYSARSRPLSLRQVHHGVCIRCDRW
jgi:hypothetical protein